MLVVLALCVMMLDVGLGDNGRFVLGWYGGFKMAMDVQFCAEVHDWTVEVTFNKDIDKLEQWFGKKPEKIDSKHFKITCKDSCTQKAGTHKLLEFVARTSNQNHADNVQDVEMTGQITGMTCSGSGKGSTTSGGNTGGRKCNKGNKGGQPSKKNYADVLGKSILFYKAQRSGVLNDTHIDWRGDSATTDCVVGGWYDAGDHVKFGLPFGASTMLLLWGMYLFEDGYVKAGQMGQAYDMVRWATDYMLDAWKPTEERLVVQIGDPNLDHDFWGRPENMTMNRPCHSAKGGAADIAGEWAGALALASILFEKEDISYSNTLLKAAKSLYTFGKNSPGKDTTAGIFYASNGFNDEMCEGAMWLYRATKNAQYLEDGKKNYEAKTAWSLSWDEKAVMCQLLLYQETEDNDKYKKNIEDFMKDWMPGGSLQYTPCGLVWRNRWAPNRYAANAAFAALAAAEAGINPVKYRTWAVEQINYLLGDNKKSGPCFSYVIGVGKNYPLEPHHRGASCFANGTCFKESGIASPNVLTGALVGGPGLNDDYKDDRSDHVKNEVAVDYNSGFTSALAGIVKLQKNKVFPTTANTCVCKE